MRYDGDGQYDRAMGPLQFLPGTWRWAGRDGDGDGRRDPQNVFDAALATAGYLCLGGRDLSRAGDLRSAVLSYNQSGDYHSAVLEWVSYFRRHGLAALTSVAFRVGSGGRASALAEPRPTRPRRARPAPQPRSRRPTGPGDDQRSARTATRRPDHPRTAGRPRHQPTPPTTPPTDRPHRPHHPGSHDPAPRPDETGPPPRPRAPPPDRRADAGRTTRAWDGDVMRVALRARTAPRRHTSGV